MERDIEKNPEAIASNSNPQTPRVDVISVEEPSPDEVGSRIHDKRLDTIQKKFSAIGRDDFDRKLKTLKEEVAKWKGAHPDDDAITLAAALIADASEHNDGKGLEVFRRFGCLNRLNLSFYADELRKMESQFRADLSTLTKPNAITQLREIIEAYSIALLHSR